MKKLFYELTLTCGCALYFSFSNFAKTPLLMTAITCYLMFFLSLGIMYVVASEESKLFSSLIVNPQEKKRIRFALVTMLNLCLVCIAFEPYLVTHGYKVFTPPFYNLNNNIGWTAIIVFCFSFLLLPIFKLLKISGKMKEIYKNTIIFLSRFLRKWHVPIAIFGMLFVVYHVYLSLLSGFKFNFTYIAGYASLFDLFVLSMMGLLRFKKVDKNLHKYLSYVFIILIALHIIFSELRM